VTECPACQTVHDGQPRFCQNCAYQFASDPRANIAPSSSAKKGPLIVFCVIVGIVLFAVGTAITGGSSTQQVALSSPPSTTTSVNPARSATPAVPEAPLELVKFSWHTEYGHAIMEGQVRNISSRSLRNVEAVATFYTADGEFITSADALIDYNPILPGQASPFKVYATENPAMKKAGVEFKELMGGTIAFRNAERGKKR
jgi:hypothetical protein